jgi:uncharacterized caspase-like protein
MKMRIVIVYLVGLLAIAALAPASAQQGGAKGPSSPSARVALAIGNNNYPNADRPLREPVGDAHALADELRHDGFDVEVGENLTKEGMRLALDRLYAKIRPGTVAMVFFSGYGIQSGNRQSYMIPTDAQIYKEADVAHDGISVDRVLSVMNDRGAAVKIIILDASRRNRFENFRRAPLGLALPSNPPGETLVLFSAAPGSVTREAATEHGLFVTELIKEMRVPSRQGDEVFNQTRMGVSRASGGEQNPSNYSSLSAYFSFGSPNVAALEPEKKPDTDLHGDDGTKVTAPSSAEARRDYERAEQLGTRAAWDDFLKKHPTGFYAGLAKDQLAKLGPAPTTPDKPKEPAKTPETGKTADTGKTPEIAKKPETTKTEPAPPALKALNDRIDADAQDADAYYKRGLYYAKEGSYPRAIKDFDEAIRLKPKDAAALNNRCWARAMISDLQNALKDCSEAIQIRPAFADAFDSRGLVNLKAGQPSNAVADYNAALKISRQASSLYGRGIAKRRTGDPSGGNKDIADAKALDPNIASEFDGYGIR